MTFYTHNVDHISSLQMRSDNIDHYWSDSYLC